MRAAFDVASQPLRNLHRNPGARHTQILTQLGSFAGGGTNTLTLTGLITAAWALSGNAMRYSWTSRDNASGDVGLTIPANDVALAQMQGQRVTAVFDLVCSVGGWNLNSYVVSGATVNGVTNQTLTQITKSGSQAVVAGVPVRCWVTFTVPTGTTLITSIRAQVTNMPLSPQTIDLSNAEMYIGDYDPKRIPGNGALPGWAWSGTAWNSESVGYPYTLESIAGPPDAAVAGVGTFTGPGPANAVTSGRTFISIIDIADLGTASFQQYATYGSDTNTGGARFAHRCKAVNDGALECFFQFPSGAQNNGLTYSSARTIGRHLVGSRWVPTSSTIQGRADVATGLGSISYLPGTAGTGISSGTLTTFSGTLGTPVYAVGYARDIGDDAMRRVMAWLARTYRATVPTGY